MITQDAGHEITAPRAAELANITYRQLDYWARQGWVKPSVESGTGRPGRRIYGPGDVVKLAALGHFGRSGLDVGRIGPAFAGLRLPPEPEDYLMLWADSEVEVVAASSLRRRVAEPGAVAVFDPAELRRRIGGSQPAPAARRTA